MTKHKLTSLVIAAGVGIGLTVAGAGIINAQTTSTNKNPMSALVTALATKFNLNTADVQSVVDETMKAQHATMEAHMEQSFADRLTKAVTDGKLTQTQADLIKAKAAELKASMEANRTADQSLTQEQRKAKMEERQTALKAWATANNISLEYLHFLGGGKGFGGYGRPMMQPKN